MTAVAHAEHPVVTKLRVKRASDVQLKIADAITAFAGSMPFVYVHVAVFAVWMLFVEKSPWPTLTLVVSLEAIFLSTAWRIRLRFRSRMPASGAVVGPGLPSP